MKRRRIAAVDVGTTKIATIMADSDGTDLRILGVGIVPSHGMQKGLVVNLREAREAVRKSVKKAEEEAGYKIDSAYVGVTGRHITSQNNHAVITIARNDRLVKPGDLKRVLNVARSIKVPDDSKVLHLIPRSYALDGQEGVKNPVGMHGFRLDIEAHVVTAAVTSVQNLAKCIRGAGVEVEDLVLEPLASAEAVLTPEEKQDGVILADIGGGTTDIAVFKDKTILHTSVLPAAGNQVTRDISIGLGLSFELAEEMKKKFGSVVPVEEGAGDKTVGLNGQNVSYMDLSEIVRVRVEEILRLVMLELPGADYARLVPAGLVLTGGSANLPGIAELGAKITGLPVRIGVPANLHGVSDSLHDPAYATSVGLLLWKSANEGSKNWKSQNGRGNLLKGLLTLFSKKPASSKGQDKKA